MAIAFARMEFVKRSTGKNVVRKAAYIDRSTLEFEGTKFQSSQTFSWENKEKPAFRNIYLPKHVDHCYKDAKTLWNAVEKFENRKDSQVAIEIVLALPDDKSVSLEDKICLIERFVESNLTTKGYGVHASIHAPDKSHGRVSEQSGELEEAANHNWHCHLLITPRTFDDTGKTFLSKKIDHLFPSLRGASHFAFDGIKWGKVWTQVQNDFFEEKGLDLRVDFERIISQEHLGPVRMRGRKIYDKLEQEEIKTLENQGLCKNPALVLEKLTSTQSIFTIEDVNNFFHKHGSENEIECLLEEFWKNKEIVELYETSSDTESQPPEEKRKFSTTVVIEEEKKNHAFGG